MTQPNTTQQFVNWFRSSSPYIHAHRGRTFVILFGGEAVEDAGFPNLIHDIALLNSLGVRLVLVHGARPQIARQLAALGLESRFEAGCRITDKASLPGVEQAVGQVRMNIEARLSMGLPNTPMSGAKLRVVSGNFVTARPYGIRNGVDFCYTGEVRKIDVAAIHQHLQQSNVVLLSPVGYSPTGEIFNLRAEEVATATAASLKADKLIILMENNGVTDASGQFIAQLNLGEAERWLQQQGPTIDDDTQRHLASAVGACKAGVGRAHLVSRQADGALLLELYTRDGRGTLITAELYEGVRPATIDDVGGILELIKPLEEQGVLARRSREQLELEIERFTVIDRDGMIIACAALYPFAEEQAGELACLAVHPDYRQQGRADTLLAHIENQAKTQNLDKLLILTTHTTHWFLERGFAEEPLEALPVARRRLYNYQRNSKVLGKTLL